VQRIIIDRGHNLIEVKLSGSFTPEDISWNGEELRSAIRSLGDGAGKHLTLYDVTEVAPLPGVTLEGLVRTFDNPAVRELWARKVAFVATSAILKMQIQHLKKVREDIGVFDDRLAALKWLLA
jgi:hypothetical protein